MVDSQAGYSRMARWLYFRSETGRTCVGRSSSGTDVNFDGEPRIARRLVLRANDRAWRRRYVCCQWARRGKAHSTVHDCYCAYLSFNIDNHWLAEFGHCSISAHLEPAAPNNSGMKDGVKRRSFPVPPKSVDIYIRLE